jgi:hypothetical protein
MFRILSVRDRRAGLTALAATGGLLALAVLTASATGATATGVTAGTVPQWRVVKTVKTDYTGQFTAIVATGKRTGWAFDGLSLVAKVTAWREKGGSWTKAAFPSVPGEEVVAAGADSPKDVWAFTRNFTGSSRVLRWNGSTWSAVRTFTGAIAGATVLSGRNVWVYGQEAEPGEPALGVWFYNGKTWTHVSQTIQGGSALSDKNVWGFSGTNVEHWNGARWTAASVRSLLPAKNPNGLNFPAVVGILALSAKNVYAFGNGGAQDEGGPLVVLHYNGSTWSKAAAGQFGYGPASQLSSDAVGGLWLPMEGSVGGTSYLLHYANGKLAKAMLPVSAPQITIGAVTRIPGTGQLLAGGYTHAAGDRGTNVVAILLRYS